MIEKVENSFLLSLQVGCPTQGIDENTSHHIEH